MTWDEFKANVDQKLSAMGANGSQTIWYIDISFPIEESIEVICNSNGLQVRDI